MPAVGVVGDACEGEGGAGAVAGELQGSAAIIAWQAHLMVNMETGVRPPGRGAGPVHAAEDVDLEHVGVVVVAAATV